MRTLMLARLPIFVATVFSGFLRAADEPAGFLKSSWPSFRGDALQTGRRDGTVVDSPRLLWTFDAKSEILSTAAIDAGRVFVGSEVGLLALDLASSAKAGKEIWRFKTESKVESSPAVRDGKIYFGDDGGILHALQAEDGKEVWKFDTKTEDGGGQEIISSVGFSGDKLLFGAYDSYLYCVRVKDGTLAWKHQTQGPVHSSPAVADGKTFIAGCDEQLRVIDIDSGNEVASLAMGGYSAASPAVLGEKLIIGTFNMQVLCIDWKASKLLWSYENPDRKFPFYSSAAITTARAGAGRDGEPVAILGGRDKLIHAIRIADGKPLWAFPTKARVDSSPVIVGSRVFVGGFDGVLYLLDVDTGKEVWRFAAGSGIAASPAVGLGRLVVSSDDGQVHCFDLTPSP
jgi:outer membrane protein assembly factor BamB